MSRPARGTWLVARELAVALVAVAGLAPAVRAAVPTTSASVGPTTSAATSGPGTTGPPSSPAGAAHVTAGGTAEGELALGSTIAVRVRAQDSLGWQHLDTIEVSLRLNGQPLDTIRIVPTAYSIAIVNGAAPVAIGKPGTVVGPYFRIDNGKASLAADTAANEFSVSFPMRLVHDPPTDAVLVLTATDASGVSSGDVNLSSPVSKQNQGFPWGTIGLAVAAALFLGGFVGNMFSTRRAKARPNVYATVARRIRDDKDRAKR